MKNESVKKCECEACAGFKKLITQEALLHAFVGRCTFNIKCEVSDFEDTLEFTSVLHWDVGYCGDARYYIYRDSEGNFLAWYDRAEKIGFKPDYLNHAIDTELLETL